MGRRGHRVTLVEGRCTVYAHRLTSVTQAALEDTRAVVTRHVPFTTHHVVDVLAQCRCLGSVLASTETEFRVGHKVRPLMKLSKLSECAGEDKTANRVAIAICTVGIEFTSCITLGNIDLSEITNAGDLHIVRGLDEVCALDSAVRNKTSSITILYFRHMY